MEVYCLHKSLLIPYIPRLHLFSQMSGLSEEPANVLTYITGMLDLQCCLSMME